MMFLVTVIMKLAPYGVVCYCLTLATASATKSLAMSASVNVPFFNVWIRCINPWTNDSIKSGKIYTGYSEWHLVYRVVQDATVIHDTVRKAWYFQQVSRFVQLLGYNYMDGRSCSNCYWIDCRMWRYGQS